MEVAFAVHATALWHQRRAHVNSQDLLLGVMCGDL